MARALLTEAVFIVKLPKKKLDSYLINLEAFRFKYLQKI
jgi:hypothetical protein